MEKDPSETLMNLKTDGKEVGPFPLFKQICNLATLEKKLEGHKTADTGDERD